MAVAKILPIVKNTLREFYRDRIFHAAFTFSIFIMLLSPIFGSLSFEENQRVIFDLTISVEHLLTIFISLLMGVQLFPREFQNSAYWIILTRPISVSQFYLGKTLGLIVSLFLFNLLMLFSNTLFWGVDRFGYFSLISLSQFLESSCVFIFCVIFSLMTRQAIAFFAGFTFFMISNSFGDLQYFSKQAGNDWLSILLSFMDIILPRFDRTNLRSFEYFNQSIEYSLPIWSMIHVLFFIILAMGIGANVFKYRRVT